MTEIREADESAEVTETEVAISESKEPLRTPLYRAMNAERYARQSPSRRSRSRRAATYCVTCLVRSPH